jgi:hypothetical protein
MYPLHGCITNEKGYLMETMKQNRANIKRDEYKDHPLHDKAALNLTLAGTSLTPWGFEYQGSASVHYYKKSGTHDFVFISHLSKLNNVPEAQSDVGLKELRRAMMAIYGREDKRRTDTQEVIL